MSAPSPVVKLTAKNALAGRWLPSAAVCTVLLLVYFTGDILASLISMPFGTTGYILFFALFTVFALFPLILGATYYFRRLLWGSTDSALIIFKFFSSVQLYKRAINLSLLLALKLIAAAVVLFLPCLLVLLLSSEWLYAFFDMSLPIWASNMWVLNSFLVIFAVLALCFVMLKYYLSAFLLVCDENMTAAEAVNMSTIISKRSGANFVGLIMSFAPWILLSLLVAPLIFTLPYFIASYCVHCRFSIAEYNSDVDRFNASSTPYFRADDIL